MVLGMGCSWIWRLILEISLGVLWGFGGRSSGVESFWG